MDPHLPLLEYLKRLTDLSPEEQEDIINAFEPAMYSKGEFVSEYGKVNDKLSFVSSGYCRVYVIDMDGNERTIHMAGNIDFVGAISSFLAQKPSDEYVQAVTDVHALNVTYKSLNLLYDKSHKWERMGRMIMEHLFLRKQKRVINFIQKTAEERYRYLLEYKSDMILNVPMQYTASFLGVTPETLSRIRAKIVTE